MGDCGGNKTAKTNSYIPKKMGGGGRASKGSYTPKSRNSTMAGFGKPSIGKVSFSGRK